MQLGTTTVLPATAGTSVAKLAASSAEVASSRSVCRQTRVSSRRVCRALSEKIARRSMLRCDSASWVQRLVSKLWAMVTNRACGCSARSRGMK